ncbi:MAG: putative Sulfate permease CysP [Promethearchaeota archaeon]|nr:MAG: putative Sulfate permease CysP [Candidatus Lokiarchaeota archaeon]
MVDEISFSLVSILVIMGISLAFAIGANDETLSALVGAGVIKFRIALIVGGIATAFGMILFSQNVGKTVGEDILGSGVKYTDFMLLAVLISSIIWLIIGSLAGIPLSSTHSTVGSIFGVLIVYALSQGGINLESALNYDKLLEVVLGWFFSPALGLLVTFIIFKIVAKFYLSRLRGLNQIEKAEKNFNWLLLVTVIFAEIWVGANSAECIGIFYGIYSSNFITIEQYWISVIICGIFVFLGIFFAGRFVIRNLASHMTNARPSEGVILQSSSALILMIATFLGLPISHSHVIVFCIIGLNLSQKKEIDKKGILKMGLYWVLTFPVAAILAGLLYWIFIFFGLS